ncbi:protein TIME FOR COFFEE-like [Phragmites australis]|uniref:protein TIME FOR COFFEE-like n=1 Tax=Phragmites australis TaxID=29695 RepID=UPI002D76B2F3|nr:protein TIME FOR COFFEE-like [Phragmites australis]
MDRIRDGRRGGVSVGGGPPPPRRRLRSNGGGGPRDSPRSERRRGERLILNGGGGGGRDDGDDTSDESLGDDDDDAEEELVPRYQPAQRRSPSTAPPPPSPPQPGGGHHHSSSSSGGGGGGGGGYHNHHHHNTQQQQMQRKGGSNPKSPIVLKAADEMIGVPVPRKARSASTKRSSHEWPVPGGGGASAGDGSQIQRPSSRPISPPSASTTAPARKKLKPLGGGGSSSGSGPAPKQRPSPSSAPSTAPSQPPPPKISKSPSFIQEEIEVAEVLFGLTRQFPCPPKQESNHKLELRDAPEAKSGNSSPAPSSAPSSSGVRPSDSTSLATIAPKRKRPRLVKYDEDSRQASPAKPELAEPSLRQEAPPVARSEAKTSTSAAAESGTSTAPTPAPAHLEASREPEKMEDRSRSRDSELRASESDRRDHRPESRAEPTPAPSGKPDGEAKPVGSEVRSGEDIATTKIELASHGTRQEKFCIDLMAPPPGKLSPDRDGASDPDADKKGLDSEMDMLGRGNSEKKDGERTRRGLEIDLEEQKVQRIPSDELAPKKLTLQLDLEKPSLGDEKSTSERRQPPPMQQPKSSKSEIKHEKSAMPAVTPPMPIPVGGWLGSFPPFGYLGPVPGLSAAGLHHPMDVKPSSSSGLQHAALLPPPKQTKRCATHYYVAQLIQYHQRLAKMNSFWPPAAAAAAAANRSAPFFGPRPFNMGVVPPTDAASLLVNPMQGSYPVRAHTPLQEAKAPSMATSPFQGSHSKDKAALGNASGAESSQRKQPPAHETQQHSTPMPNMLQGPAFIFPFNQQHAAAVAAASAANRVGDAKSSGASNAMPPSSANAHTSAANPGAAAMNLSFANLQPADAQFLAILQNGAYPFQVAAHAGGPPSYRGMAPPGPGVPFFNGHVYSSHMLHPSQQQGAQQQSLQKTPMPSLSTSSQKHQPQQSQGLQGYAQNVNAAAAASNSQNYSSGNQHPILLPGLAHRQDGDKTGQDGPSSDDKPSHPQKGGYDNNFAVPVHLPNFALMPAAPAAGSQSEKKSSDHHHHHHHHQPQVSRGQGVRIDLASSQPFVMPFGSIGPPGSAPTGLDFSSLAQNHAMFQSHQEAARHGYPQLNFAAAQSVQASQHKPQHQITGEMKSVAGDSSSTPSAGDSERKKSASTKYPGDSQQHSLSFSRTESKSYMPPFLGGNTNESSSRTLSLIGAESPNAFGIGNKSTSSSTPASMPAAASSTISQQQQQHFLQLNPRQQQQLMQQHHLNRPRSAAPSTPSNAGGYPDRLNMANFQNMMYPSSASQGGVQSPQLKASSARVTASSAAVTPPAAPPSNLIVMKNSNPHQQQAKVPMQALSTPSHQSQSLSMSSSKMGASVTNISTGGGDLSRSSNAPVASGSPSNSVSKSTGGSPPATGSAKGVQQPVQLPSPQQQSAKNPGSTSGSKSTPSNHYSMAMPSILGQQPNLSPASNPGSKQQSHMPPSLKQQPIPQGHFYISNTFTPQAPGAGGAGLYQKRSADKTQQQVPHQQNPMSAAASNNMKALHPSSGGFMHLAAAAQSAGGVPHSHMSAAQFTFGAMPMPVKPSSDQKPAAGK